MPTVTQSTVSTSVDVHTQGSNWKPIKTVSPSQDVSSTPSEKKRTSKYRHVAAYHSALRTSPLSTDSPVNPSFIGFRNLMVIVLSMSSALTLINRADVYTVVMNLRLVVENFMKVSLDDCQLGSSV
jgi:diacylglycerol O-acyltransferase-1